MNLLFLEKEEKIRYIISVYGSEEQSKYLMFTTKKGLVKRTAISEFDNIRKGGKISILLKDDDELVAVKKTSGEDEIVIGANNGRMVRFVETEIRSMGRNTSGVKGMDLGDSFVVGSEVLKPEQLVLIVTENGYGKQSPIEEYRLTHRGSKGVKALNITEKNGY